MSLYSEGKPQEEYRHLQKVYEDRGDKSQRRRNLNWYRDKMFFKIEAMITGKHKTILDIGCGNGRFNTFWQDWYDKVYCVDAVHDLDKRFDSENLTFIKKTMHELTLEDVPKVDLIMSIASFKAMYEYYEDDLFTLFNKFLKPWGRVCLEFHNALEDNFPNDLAVKWYNDGSPILGPHAKEHFEVKDVIITHKGALTHNVPDLKNFVVILDKKEKA